MRMTTTDWAMLLALSVLWGGAFVATEVALGSFPPFSIVFLRVSIAAVALNVILAARRRGPFLEPEHHHWRDWRLFLAMGIFNNAVPFSLIVWGQTAIGAGLASVINAMTPVFTVLLAHVTTEDETLRGHRLAGALLGVGGVALLIGGAAIDGLDAPLYGQLAVLAATVSYAVAGVVGRRLRHVPPMTAAAGQLAGSSALLLPVCLAVDRPWTLPAPTGDAVVAVLVLSLAGTAVAYILFFSVLRRAGAGNVMLVTLLIPATAVSIGVGALGEVLSTRQAVGMAVVLASLVVIDGRCLPAVADWLKCRRNSS